MINGYIHTPYGQLHRNILVEYFLNKNIFMNEFLFEYFSSKNDFWFSSQKNIEKKFTQSQKKIKKGPHYEICKKQP